MDTIGYPFLDKPSPAKENCPQFHAFNVFSDVCGYAPTRLSKPCWGCTINLLGFLARVNVCAAGQTHLERSRSLQTEFHSCRGRMPRFRIGHYTEMFSPFHLGNSKWCFTVVMGWFLFCCSIRFTAGFICQFGLSLEAYP